MRFRATSELGWYAAQMLGSLALPSVARDAVKIKGARAVMLAGRAGGKAKSLREAVDRLDAYPKQREAFSRTLVGTDSSTGSAPQQTRSQGPAPSVMASGDMADAFAYALKATRCPRCGAALGGMYGSACMDCDVDPPAETVTYSTTDGLWWLSWADDHRCAGIAIVRVRGEQSTLAAAREAERLDLVPEGAWQLAGIQVPEEQRAVHAPHVGRFLTTAEATELLQAQSLKSFEAENPGKTLDLDQLGIGILDAEPE